MGQTVKHAHNQVLNEGCNQAGEHAIMYAIRDAGMQGCRD